MSPTTPGFALGLLAIGISLVGIVVASLGVGTLFLELARSDQRPTIAGVSTGVGVCLLGLIICFGALVVRQLVTR